MHLKCVLHISFHTQLGSVPYNFQHTDINKIKSRSFIKVTLRIFFFICGFVQFKIKYQSKPWKPRLRNCENFSEKGSGKDLMKKRGIEKQILSIIFNDTFFPYFLKVDVSGSLSGEDIAFIYPDLKTALVGTFIHGQLLIGQTCFVRNIVNEDSLLSPTFTLPAGTVSEI